MKTATKWVLTAALIITAGLSVGKMVFARSNQPSPLGDRSTKDDCSGCLIDSVCYQNLQTNPDNICLHCDILWSTSGWTHNDGAVCEDDGVFCNGQEICGGGTCQHNGDPCGCAIGGDVSFCIGFRYCDEGNKECKNSGDPCPPGTVCDEKDDSCVPKFSGRNGFYGGGFSCGS